MISFIHAGPTILASFMASLVEFVEALTVVLAVGTVRGWRSAIAGSLGALIVLCVLVAVFGQSLSAIPLPVIQLVVGSLLLLFGLRWLRKAILRSAGVIALHDEVTAYAEETALMRQNILANGSWDKTAFLAAFKIVMLEGIEVVFIVIALGASGQLILPATLGAIAALVLVILLGLWLHRPLANIPENALKFGVGVLLAAFGTFWVGEGVHLVWPGTDWAILSLILGYFVSAHLLVWICRRQTGRRSLAVKKATISIPENWLQTIWNELISLFVDDGVLAAGISIWILFAWGISGTITTMMFFASCTLFSGFIALLGFSTIRAARKTGNHQT